MSKQGTAHVFSVEQGKININLPDGICEMYLEDFKTVRAACQLVKRLTRDVQTVFFNTPALELLESVNIKPVLKGQTLHVVG